MRPHLYNRGRELTSETSICTFSNVMLNRSQIDFSLVAMWVISRRPPHQLWPAWVNDMACHLTYWRYFELTWLYLKQIIPIQTTLFVVFLRYVIKFCGDWNGINYITNRHIYLHALFNGNFVSGPGLVSGIMGWKFPGWLLLEWNQVLLNFKLLWTNEHMIIISRRNHRKMWQHVVPTYIFIATGLAYWDPFTNKKAEKFTTR